MVNIEALAIKGVYLLHYGCLEDERGWFQKTHNNDLLNSYHFNTDIKEMYTSLSKKNVLRGMHFQIPPKDHAKYVSVVKGSIFDVVVDLRRSSTTFGQCLNLTLNAKDGSTLYLPSGIAHGFMSHENDTLVQYAVTSTYSPECDKGILWSSIPIEWPVLNPIVSGRDVLFPPLSDFKTPFN